MPYTVNPFTGEFDYYEGDGPGIDTTAIHDNVAAEISAITEKANPIAADMIVIEDSADSDNKKMVLLGELMTAITGVITPEQYGAVGDGSTDDATAIGNAVAAWQDACIAGTPAELRFQAGKNYLDSGAHTATITVTVRGGATISGYGSKITRTAGATGYWLSIVNSSGGAAMYFDGLNILGLTLRAHLATGADGCILLNGGTPVAQYESMSHLVMRDVNLEIFYGSGVVVSGNIFESKFDAVSALAHDSNTTGYCLYVPYAAGTNQSSLSFTGCNTSNGKHGLLVEDGICDVQVYGGTYLTAQNEGVRLEDSRGSAIINVHTENNWRSDSSLVAGHAGIYMEGYGVIIGCTGVSDESDDPGKGWQNNVVQLNADTANKATVVIGGKHYTGGGNADEYAYIEGNDGDIHWLSDEDYVLKGGETNTIIVVTDHDSLTNYAANEHFTEASIDHTNITAGDGSDHTFIDQAVTVAGSPTFAYMNVTDNAEGVQIDGTAFMRNEGTNNIQVGANTMTNPGGGSDMGTSTVAIGPWAGRYMDSAGNTGYGNVYVGFEAGHGTGSAAADRNNGYANVGLGYRALRNNKDGFSNMAIGQDSMLTNTDGNYNVAIGQGSMQFNTTGGRNMCFGFSAGHYNETGSGNVFIGDNAGLGNAAKGYVSDYNIGVGRGALDALNGGDGNLAVGYYAGSTINTGENNVLVGRSAGYYLTTGSRNVCLGRNAGNILTTGVDNICIGYEVGKTLGLVAGDSNKLLIHNADSATPLIKGDFSTGEFMIHSFLKLKEQAAAMTDTAGYGQLWVKNTTPCELWFTDDAGTDTQIV